MDGGRGRPPYRPLPQGGGDFVEWWAGGSLDATGHGKPCPYREN